MIAFLTSAAGLLVLFGGGGAVLAGWLKWIRPRWRAFRHRATAASDAILGREAKYDSITGELVQPALPGVGVRLADQQQQLDTLTVAVSRIADYHDRLDNHDVRITALEAAAVERVVTRAESGLAFRAMEAAVKATPSDDDHPPIL